MDLDHQSAIKRVVEENGADNLVVVMGMNGDGVRLVAETLTTGDPSWAGPLAGVSLGLPIFHILEEQVRTQIPSDTYAEKLELMEMVLDLSQIEEGLAEMRKGG